MDKQKREKLRDSLVSWKQKWKCILKENMSFTCRVLNTKRYKIWMCTEKWMILNACSSTLSLLVTYVLYNLSSTYKIFYVLYSRNLKRS